MSKLNKQGLEARKKHFKGFIPQNKSETSLMNAMSQLIADAQ